MSNKNTNNNSADDLHKKAAKLEKTLKNLSQELKINDLYDKINFDDFLYLASRKPELVFRDIFKFFHDMIHFYVPEGRDDYKVTDDSVGFVDYDFTKLFVENCDDPFFADRLFANRFINLVNSFGSGLQNNKIILFEGPPGSGKSTFLNNLLNKLEAYSNLPEGVMYKTYWRINLNSLKKKSGIENILKYGAEEHSDINLSSQNGNFIEISCPCNDHPILQIPKKYRYKLIEDLIEDEKIKDKILNSKEYYWIYKESPCHICNSIFHTLMDDYGDPMMVLKTIYAKRMTFKRQFGKGISVFNPGDELFMKPITDVTVQKLINTTFQNEDIRYIFSNLAYTNNGVYALMDIKENNIRRLTDLHGIISDGIHKVEHVEENIKSIFLGLVNPEDKKNYENVKSFQDRILHVNIPYILDFEAEVNVYKNKFDQIDELFLPRVLQNFAKIIISSRMKTDSTVIKNWLKDAYKYKQYNDESFLLLKMQLYKGIVPDWLSEEDVKSFTKQVRRSLLAESENEGVSGISGRNSINIFSRLISKYCESDNLITMLDVISFFKDDAELLSQIPSGFIDSLENLYDYEVLQHIKESIYYYSKKQIVKEILDYLFALNYDVGATEINFYTKQKIEITEELYKNFEATILGIDSDSNKRLEFRQDMLKEFITSTLANEIKLKGVKIEQTQQFLKLLDKYARSIKENALAPYIDSDNFRRAILDYGTVSFTNYPEKLKSDVTRLVNNLMRSYNYTETGAKQVCVYAIDKKIWEKFGR